MSEEVRLPINWRFAVFPAKASARPSGASLSRIPQERSGNRGPRQSPRHEALNPCLWDALFSKHLPPRALGVLLIMQGLARAENSLFPWQEKSRLRQRRSIPEVPVTTMFESPLKQEKESSKTGLWVAIGIVVVLAVVALVYVTSKHGAKGPAPVATLSNVKGDPVHDLRVVSAKMDKDFTGTTAMWSVDIKNSSAQLTYSNIAYETTYIGAENRVLLVNQGKIPITIGPGDDQSSQFRDTLYPTGTIWFKIRITDATAAK